jgi:peptide deformylase
MTNELPETKMSQPEFNQSRVQEILPLTDPFLKEKTQTFDFSRPQMDPGKLYLELRDTMIANRGLGLSANQIGYPWSVFVMGVPDNPESIVGVFNPKIVDILGEDWVVEEGCLSDPGMFVKVKRPHSVKVRYSLMDGSTNTIKFEGMTARVFLHEFDHLHGITFNKRANRYHWEQAKKQKKKLDKERKANRV